MSGRTIGIAATDLTPFLSGASTAELPAPADERTSVTQMASATVRGISRASRHAPGGRDSPPGGFFGFMCILHVGRRPVEVC